jgi:hypothetical protein
MVMDVLAAGVNQRDLAEASGAFYAGLRRCRQS